MLVVFILEGSNCPLLVLARKSLNLLPRMVDLCIVEKVAACFLVLRKAFTFAELFYSRLNCLFEAQGSWTETPKKLLQDCPIKLKNAADNMSQATYSLTPAMDPYDILQVVKVLDSLIEEVSEANFMEYENINRAYENIIDPEYVHDGENDDDDDGCGESNNSSGFEMELTRDAIASDLMNSL
ncbi:hypothetical protein Goshw_018637 [Gossypium schwendimanii]|uniref:Uncharacterized protein n=1 Tax=Gossypium schwendimanii TaxID=34291 RepID=A0A7J9MNI2_GOSSC|nr:hypothetical protein [Gossypium schwendimanii]